MFIGREEEIKAIERIINQKGYRGSVIYGRRRLGKTELLKHCLLNRSIPCIFYQCVQENEKENVARLTRQAEKVFGLSHLSFDGFTDVVEFIFEQSINKEIYLVIDEYPYIRKIISGLDSKLQNIIDDYNASTNVKLFLCGSSISTMEDILSESNPLYRRFQLKILLKEMDYYDSARFYPEFSNEDKVRLYAAFGGVPYYNCQIDNSKSVRENIINLLSGRYSSLSEEIRVNLNEELKKITNVNSAFSAIASGAFHFSDIQSKSHIESSPILSDTLDKLLKMDLVEYVTPINKKGNKMKSGYVISDSSTKFYYHYIHRNSNEKEIMSDDIFYDAFIKDDFEKSYVPKAFEKIAREYLIRKNKEGKINPVLEDIGTYWYDDPKNKINGQFDVVARNREGYLFYEVKFTSKPLTDSLIKEEVEQVNSTSLKAVKYGFISRSGFDLKEEYPYEFLGLTDIYY